MNQARKQKGVGGLRWLLTGLIPVLREVSTAEEEAFEQLHIRIQESDAGKKTEQRLDDLDDLILLIQEAMNAASSIINNSKGDVHEQHSD